MDSPYAISFYAVTRHRVDSALPRTGEILGLPPRLIQLLGGSSIRRQGDADRRLTAYLSRSFANHIAERNPLGTPIDRLEPTEVLALWANRHIRLIGWGHRHRRGDAHLGMRRDRWLRHSILVTPTRRFPYLPVGLAPGGFQCSVWRTARLSLPVVTTGPRRDGVEPSEGSDFRRPTRPYFAECWTKKRKKLSQCDHGCSIAVSARAHSRARSLVCYLPGSSSTLSIYRAVCSSRHARVFAVPVSR